MKRDVVELEVESAAKGDASVCVLCGEPNECVMARREKGEVVDGPCWCVDREFPASLTKEATGRDGGARCICAACLDRHAEEA